jgi:hypothetical protein
MYDVEAKIPYSGSAPNPILSSEWDDVCNIPQLDDDASEYQMALSKAKDFRVYYNHVRVVKIHPGGLREVIRECPYTHSHTRNWCGYSECRKS